MTTYYYPEMPLQASVWFNHAEAQPSLEPDAFVYISLSPVRPEDFFRSTAAGGPGEATHIIRTAPDARYADSYWPRGRTALFPCTIFEYPVDSAHYYVTVWAHEVGAGFVNHHARIYVTRWRFTDQETYPLFEGWV